MESLQKHQSMGYSGLTMRERAALVFHASVVGDNATRNEILASLPVPRPARFGAHLHALAELTRAYAAHYWRYRSWRYQSLYEGDAAAARGAESDSLALERALEQMAYIHGFGLGDVRKLACIEQDGYAPPWDLSPNLETLRELTVAFERILAAGAGFEDVSRTNH